MPNGHDGNAQPAIDIAEHNHTLEAKKVIILDSNGVQITSFGGSLQNTTTASAPAAVSVGVASGVLIAANASRKGLIVTNTSSATVSLNLAAGAAVLNSGLTLFPGQTWTMGSFDFTTAGINAIASAAASNVGINELT